MSENSVVKESEEHVESVEMQDGEEWGNSADGSSGTPTAIPSSAETPVMFSPFGQFNE